MRKRREKIVFFLAMTVGVVLVAEAFFCLFLVTKGWSCRETVGLPFFFCKGSFLPLLLGTVFLAVGALILAVPLAFLTAVLISELAPPHLARKLKIFISVFANLPAVIYGLFALSFIVPMLATLTQSSGFSLLAGLLTLGLILIPYLAKKFLAALSTVPASLRQGSQALGATPWETTRSIVLPVCRRQIWGGIFEGAAFACGEAAAVLLVTGNIVQKPCSLSSPICTLSTYLLLYGREGGAVYLLAILLLVLVVGLSLLGKELAR